MFDDIYFNPDLTSYQKLDKIMNLFIQYSRARLTPEDKLMLRNLINDLDEYDLFLVRERARHIS